MRRFKPIYTTFFLVIFCSFGLFSQEKTITLNTDLTGEIYTKEARDLITLEPGFKYTTSSTTSFTAKINDKLICDVGYITNPQSGTSRTLSTEKEVGSIPGSYSVSSNGAANYSMPINLPPGVNGMTPSLGINYSSQAGNGLLGWGWNLSSVSVITRGTSSLQQDNTINSVTLSNSDRFYLNGQRLILTGPSGASYGSDSSEYRTEVDNLVKVVKLSSGFKVYTPGGRIMYYGTDTESRLEGASETIYWSLSHIEDYYGNSINYTYKKSNGQLILDKISYSNNTVDFYYEDRTEHDANTNYVYGEVIKNTNLLTKIKVSINGEELREYGFNYTKDLYFLLYEVTLKAGVSGEVNSTIIDWNTRDLSPIKANTGLNLNALQYYGDFNGDGKTDILSIQEKSTYTQSDLFSVFVSNENSSGYNEFTYNFPEEFTEFKIADFDNDGNDDIYVGNVVLDLEIVDMVTIITETITYACYEYSGGQIVANPSKNIVHVENVNNNYKPFMVEADFNGDRELDYIVFNKQSNGDNTYNYSLIFKKFSGTGGLVLNLDDLINIKYMRVINFNGNTKQDILIKTAYESWVYEYSKELGEFVSTDLSIPDDFSKYQIGDFNGDGLSDFSKTMLYGEYGSSNEMKIYYGTGKGFTLPSSPFVMETPDFIEYPYETVYATDLNNDGKSDLLRFYFTVSREEFTNYVDFTPKINVITYLSTGDDFIENDITDTFNDYVFEVIRDYAKPLDIPGEELELNFDFSTSLEYISYQLNPKINFHDFNADGNGDVILKRPQDNVYQYVSMVGGEKERMVKMVTSGMNQNIEFEYATLYDSDVYERTSLGTFPMFNLKVPMYVVKKVNMLDNNVKFANVSYKYKDAKFHPRYGFLGFAETETLDSLMNTVVNTQYDFIGDLYLRTPVSANKNLGSGQNISSTTYTSDLVQTEALNNTRYYQLRSISKVSNNYLNSTSITTNYNNYNQYNQPEQTVESYGSDMTITKNIIYSPVVNGDYNLPTRVDKITTSSSHKDKEGSFSETTNLIYDGTKPYQLSSKVSRLETDKELTETYTYKTFGGVQTVSVTGGTETRSTEYVYTTDNKNVSEQTTNGQFKTEFVYNNLGQLIEQKDHIGNSTVYEYNDLGERTKVTGPTGVSVNTKKYFSTGGPTETMFVSEVYSEGKGTAYEYYNAKGQLLQKKFPGALNQYYIVEYEYYDNGKLKREYHPYKEGGTRSDNNYYEYDQFGRNTTVVTPKGTVTYDYQSFGSKTVRTESPEGWSEKTIDNAGLVTEVTDEGGTITYEYNNRANVDKINYTGYSIDYDYDEAGNVTHVNEPNIGETVSSYNAFGELITHTDAKNNSYTMQYDSFGRPITKTCGSEVTGWSYNSTYGVLDSVSNGISTTTYDYDDDWLFLESQTETIDGQNFVTGFTYNNLGDVQTVTYPGGFAIENVYDNHGNCVQIKKAGTLESIWTLDATNAKGMITNYTYGNNISTTLGFDDKYRPNSISAINTGTQTNVNHWTYGFTAENNLQFRKNENSAVQESFTYDAQNRLKTYWEGTINYADNGNISTKPDVGTYNYNATQPHAVSSITNPIASYDPAPAHTINYTHFNKVSEIIDNENNYKQELLYGPDMQRRIMKSYENNTLKKTKYYIGSYEKTVNDQSQTKELTYIAASSGLVAVNVKDFDNSENLYYIHTDYLGSIMALTNESGQKVEEYFYNAWGQRKNPGNWSQTDARTGFIIDRGYTGHEHWEHFDLINMNGRVYDPALARFLSPDPTYQSVSNSQALNKYSYVLNNPFKYTDPSGYNYASELYHTSGGGGWVSSGYANLVNSVMGDHFNAGFGEHGGNQMFAGANARMGATTISQGLGGVISYLKSSTYGGSYTVGGALSLYSDFGQAVIAGIAYNNFHNSWSNVARIGGASSAPIACINYSAIVLSQIKPISSLSSSINVPLGKFAILRDRNLTPLTPMAFTSFSVNTVFPPIVSIGEYAQSTGDGYSYDNPESSIITYIGSSLTIISKLGEKVKQSQIPILVEHYGLKGAKYSSSIRVLGTLGTAGDLLSLGGAFWNISQTGWTAENCVNLGITAVGFIPLYGDIGVLLYTGSQENTKQLQNHGIDPYNFGRIFNDFKCFAAGTKVTMGDLTYKNIENVIVGDSVLTYNFKTKKLEVDVVQQIEDPIHYKLVKIVFRNGEKIISTEDHPYYVKGKGWCSFNPEQTQGSYGIKAEKLEESDFCFIVKRNKLRRVKVIEIMQYEESIKTYNLSKIANSNNYFVNGVLVHNESKLK